jgi:hypothetical protein
MTESATLADSANFKEGLEKETLLIICKNNHNRIFLI